ncbi:YlzJ-like family protein [Bacillus sp. SD088]|uniref:YlzJ-like family protein n=1 Tax=Bacillus sp. SD088 TaxID=2782012 RepID=UPI001A9633E7|nr:YlzJ-like family protein [Bacillus sp. SD088]MBO0993061.1 YlzJ-like family protein [Bacillus sp. SD088]
MIIHTIVPLELIFQGSEQEFAGQQMITRNGIPLLVEQDDKMYKVVRIMSSNPDDYLRSDLYPGALISLYDN